MALLFQHGRCFRPLFPGLLLGQPAYGLRNHHAHSHSFSSDSNRLNFYRNKDIFFLTFIAITINFYHRKVAGPAGRGNRKNSSKNGENPSGSKRAGRKAADATAMREGCKLGRQFGAGLETGFLFWKQRLIG